MIVAARVPRKYSPVKRATGSDSGRQNSMASSEVSTVPAMNGSAP